MSEEQLAQCRIIVAFACKTFGTSSYILTSTRVGNNSRQERARGFVRYMLHKYAGIPIFAIARDFGYDEGRAYMILESVNDYEAHCLANEQEYIDPVERFILEQRRIEKALTNGKSTTKAIV